MRRVVLLAAFASAACSLFVSTTGLNDTTETPDAALDAPAANDATASKDGDGEGDAGSDAGSTCDGGGDPDLVGYWPLDEGAGTAVHDCSGHGHDGVVISMPVVGGWTTGHRGGAWSSDGNSGCIDLAMPAELLVDGVAFTATAWVLVAGYGDDSQYVFGRTKNANYAGWRIASDMPSRLTFEVANGAALDGGADADTWLASSASGQPTAKWIHMAGVYDPAVGNSIYIDGVFSQSRAPIAIRPSDTAHVRIGCRGDDTRYFDGIIDEVRLYRRALTAAEIQALASAN